MKKLLLFFTLIPFLATAQQQNSSWLTYSEENQKKQKTNINVKIDLLEKAPIKEYSYVIATGLAYKSWNFDELPDESINKKLTEFHKKLNTFLQAYKPIYVGKITGNNKEIHYYYVKSKSKLRKSIREFYEKNYNLYKFYSQIWLDKDWRTYFESLYPPEYELIKLNNKATIAKLKESGDNLLKSRKVAHTVFFTNKNEMLKFKSIVGAEGYEIVGEQKIKQSSFEYKFVFSKVTPITLTYINKETLNILDNISIFNAAYDGWETTIIAE